MTTKRDRRKGPVDADAKRVSQQSTAGLLEQRSLELSAESPLPAVHLRASAFRPFHFRKMIERAQNADPGDLVGVYDREGLLAGHGLYNPRSEIVVRMLDFGSARPDAAFWQRRLEESVRLRRDLLQLDNTTDAYRLVHAEGDGLSGLVVDRFGDVLSAEVFSLGIFQRIDALLARLAPLCGTRHTMVRVDDQVHGQEGFLAGPRASEGCPGDTIITEHGSRFRIRFEEGHKTGFFCDQRDNRRRLADFCQGRSVLDLCCYTGGFAVQAKRIGQAGEVTAVDLDERALETARENAKLNQAQIRLVHADAFAYMRDMLHNGRQYDVVVLDPPKLIRARREHDLGAQKYFDLNRLAMQLVRPGGLLLSCSCSGLMAEENFLQILYSAARQAAPPTDRDAPRGAGRTLQVLARTGAAPDHPVAANCRETEYLKAVWMRLG